MRVFARESLVGPPPAADQPLLLLEGSWPRGDAGAPRWSLDEAIDGRHAWLDESAGRLARQLVESPGTAALLAYLNELKLRYYLVKLLRLVVFFNELPSPPARIDVHLERGRDEDYAALLRELACRHGMQFRLNWHGGQPGTGKARGGPSNTWWRRAAAQLARITAPRQRARTPAPSVALCGSRSVLDGVCGELLRRRCRVTWLYERFAAYTWLRWRAAGADQRVCDAATSQRDRWPVAWVDRAAACGVDLAPALRHRLRGLAGAEGPRQSRLLDAVEAQFTALRPDVLVLDEDATPMARAAIRAAQRVGAASVVVQHGVPRVRFGFAPPAADLICAWGESSRRQFLRWGIAPERVVVTGCPRIDATKRKATARGDAAARRGDLEFVFFATTPPRDERPDAVAFHFTRRAHEEMLHMACRVVSKIEGARLTVKLHPRCRDTAPFAAALAKHPGLRARLVRSGNVWKWTRRAACVLNCTSSAGIEAAAWGLPVIELIPRGSIDLLPADEWGTAGTARDEAELAALVHEVLAGRRRRREAAPVFARTDRAAAAAVVDALLAATPQQDAAAVKPLAEKPHELVHAT